jgi:hypothetical protein
MAAFEAVLCHFSCSGLIRNRDFSGRVWSSSP